MPIYSILAITNSNQKVKKRVEFDDEASLYNYIESTGLNILSIKEVPHFMKYIDPKKFFSKIKQREVVELLSNFQIIVKSGLSIHIGLEDLAKDAENPAIADMLSDIAFQVQAGSSLSGAMAKYIKIFNSTTIGLIKIGEETGTLDRTLADAVAHLSRMTDLISKTKSALIYPVSAFIALSIAMAFWLVVVMPKILETFTSFNMELPLATRFIQGLSIFMQQYIIYIIVFLVILVVAVRVLRTRWYAFRFQTDKLILKIPIVGDLIRNFNLAFFAEYVRLMINAGLPLYQALTVIETSMTNTVFKKAVNQTQISIAAGATFSQGLGATNVFTAIIVRMLNVGEQTGRLEEQLEHIANYYYEKVNYLSQNMSKLIEPIILIFVGIFMMVILVGLLGPIYDLIGGIA